jgi:hypothetical protein
MLFLYRTNTSKFRHCEERSSLAPCGLSRTRAGVVQCRCDHHAAQGIAVIGGDRLAVQVRGEQIVDIVVTLAKRP